MKKLILTLAAMLVLAAFCTACTQTKTPHSADHPTVNCGSSLFEYYALSITDSSCGYYMEGNTLVLTYDNCKQTAVFPEEIINDFDNPDNSGYDHRLSNTGIYVSNKVSAVSIFDENRILSKVYVSHNRGNTWQTCEIDLKGAESFLNIIPSSQYIGFTSENDGWLIAATYPGSSKGIFALYQTNDGGASWHKTDNNLWNTHGSYVIGAGFADSERGFICYDNQIAKMDVYATTDGGITWNSIDLLSYLPTELQNLDKLYALSPVFDGSDGVIPVEYYENGEYKLTYLYSNDAGNSWYHK